jgi:hypothetical protein
MEKKIITRVRWTQEEIEALVARWVNRHNAVSVGFTEKGIRRVALEAGFGYRPRQMTADQGREFAAKWATLAKELATAQTAKSSSQEPEEVEPAPEMPPAPASASHSLDDAIKFLIEERLTEFENRLTEKILLLLGGIPGYRMPVIPKRLPVVDTKTTEKKQVVILVNALAAQVHSVERAYPELDIRAVNDRLPNDQDPALVIGLHKFLSHSLEAALKRRYGSRYVAAKGAADSVKQLIQAKLLLPPL